MIDLDFKKLEDQRMAFDIHGVSPYFVNSVRRTLAVDVPKLALEDIEFHLGPVRVGGGKEYESISPSFDETVAHRLGLVPIPTDLETQLAMAEGSTPSLPVIYKLSKKGPCVVYSGDLEPIGDITKPIRDPLIPLIKLTEGQAPLIYATAVLGTGRQHAKWMPCSGIGYHYDSEDLDERGQPKTFTFTFETDGSITTLEALRFALRHLEQTFAKVDELVAALEG